MSERPGMRLSLKSAYMSRNLSWCVHCRKSAVIDCTSGVMVAESSSVCTDGGSAPPMALMSPPYPYDSSRSASSTTSVCSDSRSSSPLRPRAPPPPFSSRARSWAGVAIITSGGLSALIPA
eukprot:3937190-Prymnesium_polylepis.1